MGEMLCDASASRDEQILRAPNVAGPSNTRIEGFPIRVPAIYDRGERSNKIYQIPVSIQSCATNLQMPRYFPLEVQGV